MLYACPFYYIFYHVGLFAFAGCVLWVEKGRLLGRLASVLWVCVPDHVPDLKRWLVWVAMWLHLTVCKVKVSGCMQTLSACTVALSVCKQKVFAGKVILSTCKPTLSVCTPTLYVWKETLSVCTQTLSVCIQKNKVG